MHFAASTPPSPTPPSPTPPSPTPPSPTPQQQQQPQEQQQQSPEQEVQPIISNSIHETDVNDNNIVTNDTTEIHNNSGQLTPLNAIQILQQALSAPGSTPSTLPPEHQELAKLFKSITDQHYSGNNSVTSGTNQSTMSPLTSILSRDNSTSTPVESVSTTKRPYRNTESFPKFSGYSSDSRTSKSLIEVSRAAREWLDRTTYLLNVKEVPAQIQLMEGTTNLTGQAAVWFMGQKARKGIDYDWPLFSKDFLARYCSLDDALCNDGMLEITRFKQGNLSVDTYAQKFMTLADQWHPNEDDRARAIRFVAGLKPELAAPASHVTRMVMSSVIANAKITESQLALTRSQANSKKPFTKKTFQNHWKKNKNFKGNNQKDKVSKEESKNSKFVKPYNKSSNYSCANGTTSLEVQQFTGPFESEVPVDQWSPYPLPTSHTPISTPQALLPLQNLSPLQQQLAILQTFQQLLQLQQNMLLNSNQPQSHVAQKQTVATQPLQQLAQPPITTPTDNLPNSSFVGSILTFNSYPQQIPPKLLDTVVNGSYNYELLVDSGSTTDAVSLSIVRTLNCENQIVKFNEVKRAALVRNYVSIIGYIVLNLEIQLKYTKIQETRSFYVIDTDRDLFLLGLPFIQKYQNDISLQDLVSADIQPLQPLPNDNIQISTFEFEDNYVTTLLKNKDNSIFFAEIYHMNDVEDTNTKSIDVEITTPLANNLRSKILSEFADIVTNDPPSELPPYRKHVHKIILKEPRHVTAKTQYPLSYAEKQELTKQVDQLIAQGFVRSSTSPFNSPVLFVRKKDNTLRMCVDFRLLNNNTIKDKFPIPHIDQLISRFGTAKVYSKLDLMSGYYQVRIQDEDIEKTAFSTDTGHYEWVVMPFGLTNAPATFQRMMNTVLQPYLTKFVQVYLDDIFIYSNDYEQHYDHIAKVLKTLRENKLVAKLKKCAFFYRNLRFLGHVITPEGIQTDPEKVDKVRDWPTPKTPKDGMKFLGLTSYYRKFIKDHSKIAKPIHDFINKKCSWSTDQNKAFETLKKVLISAPTVVHPIWKDNYKFVLHTDACGNALGYTLEQLDPNGKIRGVIAYGSKKLVGSQLNYGIYDREFLAVVEALKTWRYYLLGRHFLIYTDHKSLVHLRFQNLIDSTRVARWLDYLAQYDFDIKYILGPSNSAADALSRYPYESNSINALQILQFQIEHDQFDEIENSSKSISIFNFDTLTTMKISSELKDKIIQGYKKDSYLGEIYDILRTKSAVPSKLHHHIQHYKFEDDLLYYRTLLTDENFTRVAVPHADHLPQHIISNAHSTLSAGHFGIWKTYQNLFPTFYWKSMLPSIKRFCNTCVDCQKNNSSTQKLQGLFSPLPVPEGRWTDVSMDFLTGIPTSARGFDMIMVITDRFTKMAHFIPTDKKLTSDRCARLFVEFCWKHHGFPRRLVSDKDIRFMSRFWHTVHFLVGTSLLFSTTNHPQTDGQTERVNKIVNQLLRKHAGNDMFNWDQYLPITEFAYNSTYQDSIKMPPFKLAYGYVPDSPKAVNSWDISDERYSSNAEEFIRRALLTLRQAQDNIVEAQRVQEHHYNLKRRNHTYKRGDWVLIHRDAFGHNSLYVKIQPVFYGPFKLVKDLGNNTFEVDLPSMNKKDRELNVQCFRPYQEPEHFLQRLPVTDLEIRARITEIVGIGGYDKAADTFDVFWRDCDPRHATSISRDQFNLLPKSLRLSLLHNAQIELPHEQLQ
ncbi:hypothetical protein CANINC_004073 [Pichia inconspicua]|uniref:RNA-directed DNA polymerase n=1 Tax=Pichia inconspicua TaxID=52247 RepID=A0A4T0WX49_9ASCO|nr:hypothetical protein CANINC_004073 [[Candida] inconspicua]